MLVLGRKKNQKVILYRGKERIAEITVADIRNKRVKLGFDAPKEITIDREEVFESKHSKKGNV